jgi:Mce-associated membrane protein
VIDDQKNDATGSSAGSDIRATRRAQREAERAARAQRKADAARERALEAARAGGLFEGMEAIPRTAAERTDTERADTERTDTEGADAESTDTGQAAAPDTDTGRPARTGAGVRATPATTVHSEEAVARRRRLIPILAVVSVVLLVLAGLATWQYVEARERTATEQTIAAAPKEATDAAREIVTQMFTYDHRTVDADLAAVRERLTDPALTEFVEQSMPSVASAAKQQEASVYATVAAAAPQEVVDADRVRVLVMLNRMVSTKESPEAASSASRLSVEMVRVDGTWKLGELSAL